MSSCSHFSLQLILLIDLAIKIASLINIPDFIFILSQPLTLFPLVTLLNTSNSAHSNLAINIAMFFSPIFIWFCPIYSILPTHHLSLLTLLSTSNTTQIDLTNMASIEKSSFLVTLILCQLLTLLPLLTILSTTNTAYINLDSISITSKPTQWTRTSSHLSQYI